MIDPIIASLGRYVDTADKDDDNALLVTRPMTDPIIGPVYPRHVLSHEPQREKHQPILEVISARCVRKKIPGVKVAGAKALGAKTLGAKTLDSKVHKVPAAKVPAAKEKALCLFLLRHISLHKKTNAKPIMNNDFVMVTGPPKAGKSTLLRVLAGFEYPDSGYVRLFGQKISEVLEHRPNHLRALHVGQIGFVPQNPVLMRELSTEENIKFPTHLACRPLSSRTQRLLVTFGLTDVADKVVTELPRNKQQIIAIAQSLANRPSLLFLDEPTQYLSPAETVDVMDILFDLNRADASGVAIVMVTSNPLLACYANRVIHMVGGEIQKEVIIPRQYKLMKQKYIDHVSKKEEPGKQEATMNEDDVVVIE